MTSNYKKLEQMSLQQPQTPTGRSNPTSPIPDRPKTPQMKSRIDEKNALIGLNNRLAALLEKKSQLEDENQLLSKELRTERENTITTLTRLQTTYDGELNQARKAYSESEKDRARVELALSKLVKDLDDANDRLDKRNREAKVLGDRLSHAEGQIKKLLNDLQNGQDEKNALLNEKRDMKDEIDRMARAIDDLRDRLEAECVGRIELASKMQSQTEDFTVKSQIYEQEIVNIKSLREVEIEEMDGRIKKEYESKLDMDVQRLRDDFEVQALQTKEHYENLYNAREADLRGQIGGLRDALVDRTDELGHLTTKLNNVLQRVSHLEGENHGYQRMIRELEKKIEADRTAFDKELARRDAENAELRKEKDRLIKDYADLWDNKVALDNEIATYHMLLDGEERRLSMKPHESPSKKMQKTTTISQQQQQHETTTTKTTKRSPKDYSYSAV